MLAKPPRNGRPGRTVIDHTRDVVGAFRTLFGDRERPTEVARCWARFFRLTDLAAFLANGLVAAACHDWGKSNDGFQRMLSGGGPQLLRHELVSAVLVNHQNVWAALGRDRALDMPLVLAAVVGHHLKARDATFGQPQGEFDTILHVAWPELRTQLAAHAAELSLPEALPDDLPRLWSFAAQSGVADLFDAMQAVRDRLELLDDKLEGDGPRRHLLWAVRAALIAADSAGSGLFREGKPIDEWIGAVFDPTKRLDGASVQAKVIRPRLDQLGDRWGRWNDFQEACGDPAQVPARALLLAPCGSGKTLAAWRWIAARCAEHPVGRAIFLYPTRGTATEGYRDYVSHAGPEEAALVHGTAELDLEGIHPNIDDEQRVNEARLFALRQWPKRIFSATVDQFLGFLQHGYGPTCLLPLLADSVVVFDEVHSYDRGMFSALLQFLEHFDVPALCMTATLLRRRRDQLAAHVRVVNGLAFSGKDDDLRRAADHKRYRVVTAPDAATAESLVRAALTARKRVLWVVNTVDRARDFTRRLAVDPGAGELATPDGIPVFCYHSRYKLIDRKRWHERVIAGFRMRRDDPRPVLAVTTQVCEMSLDLDADLLVTEYAPATALVQRLGRCCRDPKAHENGRVGDVILYQPVGDDGKPAKAPYTDRDLAGVDAFVARLAGAEAVSQSDLEDFLEAVPHAADLPRECRFIESGPWAASGEENFRDIDDYTRQALMPGDIEEYSRRDRDPRTRWKAQELILPVPRNMVDSEPAEGLPRWLGVADARHARYDPALGYGAGRPDPKLV